MINFIKDAVTAVSGIKSFLFNTDYRNNFDLQDVEFPCCVLTPIMRTNYDLKNIIRESAELQLSVVDLAPYEYTGDELYAINKRCSDLALQVIANLQVKSKLDKELTFEFILPSGDELISGVMCNLTATMKQGSCIGAPSYVEIVVQPIKKESITSNGKHVITPSNGFTAMKKVEVDVNVDLKGSLQDKQVTITDNGTTTITADEGFEGLNSVEVNANVAPPLGLIGWDEENTNMYDAQLAEDIAYSKALYDAWDANNTSASYLFHSVHNLVYAPYIDTSKVTNMSNMFGSCPCLIFIPKLDTSKVTNMMDMFKNSTALRYIPLLDTHNVTNMPRIFNNCTSLITIPPLDLSNVTSIENGFQECKNLKYIPPLNLGKVKKFSLLFHNCSSLVGVSRINTSSGTDFNSIFRGCISLTEIPQIYTSNAISFQNSFLSCSSLISIPLLDASNVTNMLETFGHCSALENFGGLKNIKVGFSLSSSTKLTHESLMNVINNLYDLASNGLSVQTLSLGATNLEKLTDEEKAVAVDKGWTLA